MTTTKQAGVGPLKYAPGLTKTLVVQVTDPATKRGVSGASVEVWGLRGGYLIDGKPDPRRVNTGADGSITFKDLPVSPGEGGGAKEWIVKVNKEQFGPPTKPFRVGEVVVRPTPTGEAVCKVTVELTSPKVDVTVRVVDGKDEAKGVAGASVELWGLRGGWDAATKKGKVETNAKGEVVWKGVSLVKADGTGHDALHLKVNKAKWGFYAADRWSEGEVSTALAFEPGKVAYAATLKLFPEDTANAAELGAIRSFQQPLAGVPREVLYREGGKSPDEAKSLSTLPPAVYLVGGPAVRLEVRGKDQSWGQGYIPATWTVARHGDSPTPGATTITGHGGHADLATSQAGIYTVTATANGKSLCWNVCLIAFRITGSQGRSLAGLPHGSVAEETAGQFAGKKLVVFKSGKFTAAETPWLMTWSAEATGGRAQELDKALMGPLQNGTAEQYVAKHKARFAAGVPEGTTVETTTTLPILDTGLKAPEFYCVGKSMFSSGPSPSSLAEGPNVVRGATRHFQLLDAPGFGMPLEHAHTDMPVVTVRGNTAFRVGLAAHTEDSPGVVLVYATLRWGVNLRCKVEENLFSWSVTDDGSNAYSDGAASVLAQPAGAPGLGFRLVGPRFIDNDAALVFTSTCMPACPKDGA